MEPLRAHHLRFRVHGPDRGTDEVPASMFAHQLATLVRALKAADRAVNHGRAVHDYTIAKLQTSVPTAILSEHVIQGRKESMFGTSGILAFQECVEAILTGQTERALSFGNCASQVARFKKTGYSEVWTSSETVLRVDPFLTERAKAVMHPESVQPEAARTAEDWFKGAAHGSFDGEIKEADLRGALPQIILILSAGGAQIDCICREEHVDDITASLNKRVRVFGRALYDGRSGLPRRVEVDTIAPIQRNVDFTRWSGSFEPFEIEPWEGEE